VLKRLKLPKLFNDVALTFPTREHMGVFLVSSDKNQISPLSPLEKLLEKSTSGPPGKKSFQRPCTQARKITPVL